MQGYMNPDGSVTGGPPGDNEVSYIGEFQTEHINSEIFGLFECENKVMKKDLYVCAKAMGGWTEQDGKFFVFFISVNFCFSQKSAF